MNGNREGGDLEVGSLAGRWGQPNAGRRTWGRHQATSLFEIGLDGFDETVGRQRLLRAGLSIGIKHMKSNLVFEKFHHERVHGTSGGRDQPEDIATILFLGQGPFQRFHLPANATSSDYQLFFVFCSVAHIRGG